MTELGTCATCKHWRPTELRSSGLCAALSESVDESNVSSPANLESELDDTESERGRRGAAAIQSGYYYATVMSRPDFGCTMHEAL